MNDSHVAGAAPDPLAEIRQDPLLCPWIVAEPVPTLTFVDACGRQVAIRLDARGLARLALLIANAQAIGARKLMR